MSPGDLKHLLPRDRTSRQHLANGEELLRELLDEVVELSLLTNIEGDALGNCCEGELKCSVLF